MAEPDLSPWGERLRERTAPLQPDDEANGWAHAILCEALARPYLQVAELIDPPDPYPPWAPLFDINTCPEWAIPWLAQLTGTRLPDGLDLDGKRDYISNVAGFSVGSVAAMKAAVSLTLTPTPGEQPTVYFRERDGSPYRLEIVTLIRETPDPARALRAILAAKPGGILLEFRQVEGWDYQANTAAGGTYATLKTTFSTYTRMRDKTPG